MTEGLLFPGPAGLVASAAVQVALRAGVSGNAALLFGRICSFNGKPFWELRRHLQRIFGVCKRTVTRYFRELVDAALIVNKPAPLGQDLPGRAGKKPLPYRPWFKWAVGLPEIRDMVRAGSREAYERAQQRIESNRTQRQTRSRLASTIGMILRKPEAPPAKPVDGASHVARARRWTPEEIDRAMDDVVPSRPSEPPERAPPD